MNPSNKKTKQPTPFPWQLGSQNNVPTGPNLKENGWMETKKKEQALQSEISSKQ